MSVSYIYIISSTLNDQHFFRYDRYLNKGLPNEQFPYATLENSNQFFSRKFDYGMKEGLSLFGTNLMVRF